MVTKTTRKKSSKTTKLKTIKKVVKKKAAPKKKAVAKKAVNKKAAAKKVAKKKTAARSNSLRKRIKPEQYFYLRDGAVLKSINDLAKMMDSFEDELFNHHVNDERNDFANWIENVFEEAELARQLMEAEKDKQKNHYIILKYVFNKK